MKTCDINMSGSQLADIIRNHMAANLFSGKAETQQEAINRMQLFDRLLESKELGDRRGYGVKGISIDQALIEETFTTEGSKKFERKKGTAKAKEINENPFSIAQRDTGTYLHKTLEDIIGTLATSIYKDKVLIRDGSYKSIKELRAESKLSEEQFNTLYKTAERLIKDSIETQKQKDPTGKVYIAPEQRLMASTKLAGTADLIFLYSDVTADHYDYKSMSPKGDSVRYIDGKQTITSAGWIPYYKYEDWNLQLPKTTHALENVIGINRVERSRIVPMQLQLESKDGKPTGKIRQLETFATANEFLSQIPIKETTTDTELNKRLNYLTTLKNNFAIELGESGTSRERKEYLRERINKLTRAINSIIVDKDVKNLVDDYTAVIRKYASFDNKRFPALKNISDQKIDDKTNINYLELQEHRELLQELTLISSIIGASYEFYDRMDITDEEYAKYRGQIERLQNNISILVNQLQNELFKRVSLTDTSLEEIEKGDNPINAVSKLFNTFGEIQHPVFREAFDKISLAESKAKVDLQNFKEELNTAAVELENYGKSIGLGLLKVYDKLINKETGRLYAMHSSGFYETLKLAMENRNPEFIDKHFKLKEDAEKRHTEWVLSIINKRGLTKDNTKEINKIIEANKLEDVKFDSNNFYRYYELKPEIKQSLSSEIYSPEYIEIQKTPALKNYYEFWTTSMRKFRKLTGMNNDFNALPDNFIPYFRAGLIEQMFQGGLPKAMFEKFMSIFREQGDNSEFGYMAELAKRRNVLTNEVEHDIPLFGLHPLYNKEGVLDNQLKSYDLTNVLYTFADAAFNYNHYKAIEAEITVLGDMVQHFGVKSVESNGKIRKTLGDAYTKLTGQQLEEYRLYLNMIKFHVYGIKEQGDVINKDITNTLSKLNNMQRYNKMAWDPIIQASASLSSKVMSYYEGVKGHYYTTKMMGKSEKLLVQTFTDKEGEGKLVTAVLQYFEFDGKHSSIKASELPSNSLISLAKRGLAFIGFRKGSEWIDNSIGLSMMQNYGIDANGRLKRLKMLPKDSKSLLELSSIKDGKLEIQGLTIEGYNWFVNAVRGVSRTIKGELSENDQRAINFTILGKLGMTYKNWLPDLYKEHFNGVKYNNYTDTVTIGRINAIYENLKDDESKKFLLLNQAAWIGLGKLALDVPLSMLTLGKVRISKANEGRARALFEKFKSDNLYDKRIQEYTYEEFLDYYNGQIKAGVAELSVLLTMILLGMLAGGDWDDDGKKDYQQYLALNWTYRTLNRVKRELGFFYGSEGFDILFQTSFPVTSVALDGKKAIINFIDEAYHDIAGIDDNKDRTGYFHYTSKQIPVVYPLMKLLDKDREI
jgi:hypothetical protein